MIGKDAISIWFFIGSLLLIYGVAIFAANVVYLFSPSAGPAVVLAELHFGVWWGALLIIIGATYLYHFWPWRRRT